LRCGHWKQKERTKREATAEGGQRVISFQETRVQINRKIKKSFLIKQ